MVGRITSRGWLLPFVSDQKLRRRHEGVKDEGLHGTTPTQRRFLRGGDPRRRQDHLHEYIYKIRRHCKGFDPATPCMHSVRSIAAEKLDELTVKILLVTHSLNTNVSCSRDYQATKPVACNYILPVRR